jgi:Zn-dependent peptidase ImmA (M78 family)/DNA-binding XRE family transcriptional regulator
MDVFSPVRLQIARERRRLFRKELAALCQVTPQTVSNWETGRNIPLPEAIAKMASELGFPEQFFLQPEFDRLPEGAANFRARTKLAARDKHAALAAGDLARELAGWIEARFELPPVRLPDLKGYTPELAAQVIRNEWMLGERSIPNMVHLLESRGVLVFSLCQDCQELDAFSFWSGPRPIVMLNTMKSSERSRIDAAHELFHLVAHTEETGKQEEEDSDTFAGIFLMPKGDVLKQVPRVVSLQQLIQAKQRWGTSLASLVYRLHKLDKLTDWQYRTLFVELSKRGYRTVEPNSTSREQSTLLAQVFEALRAKGTTLRHVAADLAWPLPQLQELLFGLGATMMGVEGGGGGNGPSARNHLRLV